MTHRIGLAALAIFACAGLWLPAIAQEVKPATDLFAEPKIWPLHITIPAKEYEAMQPAGGGPMGFFGGPKQPAPKPADGRETHRNAFGMELPLAFGSLVADGVTFPKIGVRYKGNGTIIDAMGTIKKSLKLDLNRYDANLRFHGLKTINLNSGVADPTKGRETLGYAAYRRAGVPAPRTTFAEVTLTVPGKYDREYLGLYTILESVDKGFLKSHFKNDQGLLMKPERAGSLNHFGDDWERYKTPYQPKRDATPDEAKRVIAFTKLVHLSSDEQFRKEIESYLDVDAFLRFMAVTAMIVNVDSFFTLGHNYLLYLHPETNKFHFIPWDLDRAFANHPLFGSPDQQMDMTIAKPYAQCRLPDRLLAVKEYRDRQQTILKETAATFTKARLLKDIDAFDKITKDIVAKGTTAAAARREGGPGAPGGFGPPGGGPFGRVPDLRSFTETRTKSIEAQLTGKSTGYTIAMGFGGFGPPPGDVFGAPGGMGPANLFAKPLLDRMDVNKAGKVTEAEFVAGMKKLFAEWDKDKNGAVDQRELTEGLQRLVPGPQMGPFPGGFPGGPPGGPPGKGPPGGLPGPGPK